MVRVSDVDEALGRVKLHGGSKVLGRWAPMTQWGTQRVHRRMHGLARTEESDPLLASRGPDTPSSGQASSCAAIRQIFERAGLGRESDIRPASVAGWAGAGAFTSGASIDEVARLLGLRSLDRTARLIAWDWTKAGRDG